MLTTHALEGIYQPSERREAVRRIDQLVEAVGLTGRPNAWAARAAKAVLFATGALTLLGPRAWVGSSSKGGVTVVFRLPGKARDVTVTCLNNQRVVVFYGAGWHGDVHIVRTTLDEALARLHEAISLAGK